MLPKRSVLIYTFLLKKKYLKGKKKLFYYIKKQTRRGRRIRIIKGANQGKMQIMTLEIGYDTSWVTDPVGIYPDPGSIFERKKPDPTKF